jgi:glycosyltransferase involved in cell wall biosynthesis
MKNKKLIAIFSPAMKKSSFVSGIAVYNHRLIKELSRYYDFHIINNNKYDSRYRSEKYFFLNNLSYSNVIYNLGNFSEHYYMLKHINKYPGIIVLHEAILDLLIKYSLRKKIKLSNKKKKGFISLEEIFQKAKKIIVHSNFLKKFLIKNYQISKNKINVIYHFNSKKYKHTQFKKYFCTFGNLHKAKDGLSILKAWDKSEMYKKYNFFFVGKIWKDNNTKMMFNYLKRHKHLKGSVFFTQFLNKKKFEFFLNNTKVAIQIRKFTRGESSGTIVELLARKKIIITNNIDSLKEIPNNTTIKLKENYNVMNIVNGIKKSEKIDYTLLKQNIEKYLKKIDIKIISKKFKILIEN